MDLQTLVIILVAIAFAFYALERIPFPAQPPWLKRAVEALLAIIILLFLLQRVGINVLPHG